LLVGRLHLPKRDWRLPQIGIWNGPVSAHWRQLEVRLLVIDEIHSLLAGTYREQRILPNSIRFLANDLRLPLVCAGTHEAQQALMTDQQLADRFEAASRSWNVSARRAVSMCS
jgi:gamma-glutamyl:cysteine ligase YbdK (ATP-grasp superfamily)